MENDNEGNISNKQIKQYFNNIYIYIFFDVFLFTG